MMPDWTDVKEEGKATYPSRASTIATGAFAELHRGTQCNPGPDPELLAVHTRTPSGASERQRTVQACDKCRERKTKCSGDHPVCHRCTSRGLICQYSSREPRARGPSKARLRNAVSSSDLRTSSYNPPTHTQAKSERPSHQLQHFRSSHGYESNGIQRSNYQGLRRVASIPRTHLNSQHTKKGLMSIPLPPPFQSWRDTCAAPASPFSFEDGNFPSSHFHMPSSVQYAACGGSASPWHDVRRVHSHSTLIGSTGTNIKKSINYGMHSPLPLMNGGDYLGAGSYGHVSAPGRHSPDFLGSLQSFDAMPQHTLSSSYDPQPQPLRTPDIYPWLPPDAIMTSENHLSYSPASSSEDEPRSRSKSGNSGSAPGSSTFAEVSSPFDFLSLSLSSPSTGGYSADLSGCGNIGGNYFLAPSQGGGGSGGTPGADMSPLDDHMSSLGMSSTSSSLPRPGSDPTLHAAGGVMYPCN